MPNLLSIPRELRDDIYERLLGSPLQPNDAKPSRLSRKRVSKAAGAETDPTTTKDTVENTSDPHGAIPSTPTDTSVTSTDPNIEYYDNEQVVRYPATTPLPPLHSLLATSRQLRAELKDTLSRKRLHYKIRLACREDTELLYPTWLSVPVFAQHVDSLDVELRFRANKTSSLVSANGDDDSDEAGDPFSGGLVLLRRFLERGVYFLGKKKARKISVGVLSVTILRKDLIQNGDSTYEELLRYVWDKLDDWFHGELDGDEYQEKQDELMQFLAGRIGRMELAMEGIEERRGWELKDVLVERARREVERRAEREERERVASGFWL